GVGLVVAAGAPAALIGLPGARLTAGLTLGGGLAAGGVAKVAGPVAGAAAGAKQGHHDRRRADRVVRPAPLAAVEAAGVLVPWAVVAGVEPAGVAAGHQPLRFCCRSCWRRASMS